MKNIKIYIIVVIAIFNIAVSENYFVEQTRFENFWKRTFKQMTFREPISFMPYNLKVGYFLTTSLFLFTSYYFLGERRWILMFLLSFPFVAAFMYLLHGILDIYLRDPFLKSIGVMG